MQLPTGGASCLPEAGDVPACAPPSVCLDEVCHARAPIGIGCSSSFECAVSLRCGDAGLCEPAFSEGKACEGNLDCVSLSCVEGSCAAPKAAVCGPIFTEEAG